MPPKASAAAGPRRRTTRMTARKSILAATGIANYMKETVESIPQEATPFVSPQNRKSPAKTPPRSAAQNASIASANDIGNAPMSVVPENVSHGESESDLYEASSGKNAESKPGIDEDIAVLVGREEALPEKASEGVVTESYVPEKAGDSGKGGSLEAAQAGGAKTGTKKVVKKTMRIVKKVVKKRVPKRVPKGLGVTSTEEESRQLETENDTENPSLNASVAMEAEQANRIVSEPTEVDNINPETIASVSQHMEAESLDKEQDASFSMEVGHTESRASANVDAEDPNSCPTSPVSVAVEGANPSVIVSIGVKYSEDDSLKGYLAEETEAKSTGIQGGEQAAPSTENRLEDQNMGAVEDEEPEAETSNSVGSGGIEEKIDAEKTGIGLQGEPKIGDRVALSGEMEALERRRQRKTEIFIGGLDKDAKEEDIRNVFGSVGEIVEVRLLMNDKTGKNKGFGFVRYASAADAKTALEKFSNVEICGKQCGAKPVEGNDTIFLGNIDKKWTSEDVVKLLQEIGVEKIDKVAVMTDPNNIERNRGFAFLELESSRDAQIAYKKLQKKDAFGKHLKIKVAWAEPLIEPNEEEMLKVKSVYAEYLPSSWDEETVKHYFKKFGEIENVVLARTLLSSRRKDFAFVNYTTREAALACIETFNREPLRVEGSKVNVKVSLAKPLPKGKQARHVSDNVNKETPKEKPKAAQTVIMPHQPKIKGSSITSSHDNTKVDRSSSTTTELVQLLREQATWRQPRIGPGIGTGPDYPYSSPGMKRPYAVMGADPDYSDSRGYPLARFESSFHVVNPSYSGLSQGACTTSSYHHCQDAGFGSGSSYGAEDFADNVQARRDPYNGSTGVYRRY